MDTYQSNLAEIAWGKLAAQKATNPELRQFGNDIATGHAKWNNELRSLLGNEHMTLPDAVSAKDQATYDKLNKLSEAAFDKAMAAELVKAHQTAIKEFSREAKSGKDARLQNFASEALPVLEQHLEKIRSIHSQIRTS